MAGITIKTKEDIEILKESGKHLAHILNVVKSRVAVGVSTADLNTLAMKIVTELGDEAAFLHYKPYGADRPYPAGLCVSVNDAVVHGIPNERPIILKEGDVVSLDMGVKHRGMITDSAVTVGVGKIDAPAQKLLDTTKEALVIGIKMCRAGNRVGDVGYAIESYVRPFGFGIIEELAGHGVGYKVHEDPYVPNYGKPGTGELLRAGMVLAIEPMLTEGTHRVFVDEDGYTYRTEDGKRAAHFEHTIVVTNGDPIIVTQ